MKKLSLILLFSLLIMYSYFYLIKFDNNSKYKLDDKIILAKIININKDDKKVTIELKGKEKIYGYLSVNKNYNNLELGDIILCTGTLNKPKENTNFNLFNFKKYLISKKIHYVFNIDNIKIIKKNTNIFYKLKNNIINKIEKLPKKEYFYIFILGNNGVMKEQKLEKYRSLGIIHLLAISGMHVSFITLFLRKNKLTFIFSMFILCIYAFLNNFSPSIIRAILFYIFSSLKLFRINIKSNLYILYTFMILISINPGYIYNLGFIFSFTISFYLVSITIPKNKIKASIYISLISFLASIPIILYNFYEINILSILYNLFFVPFISLVFILTIITFIFPLFIKIFIILISFLENIINICALIPSAIIFHKMNIIIIIIYYIILYSIVKNKINKINLLIPIILYILSNIRLYNTITMIDVGQGDSSLIELVSGKNILIDTGGVYGKHNYSDYNVVPYLKSRGIRKIDYLILSHGDYDHIGEYKNVLDNFSVKKVLINSGNLNKTEKKLINYLNVKKIKYYEINEHNIKIDKYKFYFLNKKSIKNENNDSLILYTKLYNYNMLFMGDADKEAENYILDTYNLQKVDILKVGHHGSNTSSSYRFIKQISPKISLISVGENNKYNHPNKEVIDNLSKINSNIYLTKKNGMIRIKLRKKLEIESRFAASAG